MARKASGSSSVVTAATPVSRPGRSPLNDKRYADIVEIAAQLFAAQGYEGTSLQDIAVAVGVLKGSLYHYISSKEDLLFDVVKVSHEGLHENLDTCRALGGNALEQLVAFSYGHVVLNTTRERFTRGAVYIRDGGKLPPDKREVVVASRDEYERYLRQILRSGQEQGLIDPDVHPRVCSFAILGVVNSYLRWFDPAGPMSREELAREFAAFTLASVRVHFDHAPGHRWDLVDDVVARYDETNETRRIETAASVSGESDDGASPSPADSADSADSADGKSTAASTKNPSGRRRRQV
jgi:TetR/AcrR family transcriptional regulator, cholesterol catabolism regulator